jgi:hypothetical protein
MSKYHSRGNHEEPRILYYHGHVDMQHSNNNTLHLATAL